MIAQPLLAVTALVLFYPAPPEPDLDDQGRGFFGVQMLDNGGVQVARVEPKSPAAKAGFEVNDIIQKIDATPVSTINEARDIIGRMRPGAVTHVEVRRGEANIKIKVKVGLRPADLP
jgi:S1-C subfamily serine protease